MALKIRLRQQGRKNHSVYRLVVTDVRAPRDGKYIEMLGWYNPNVKEELTCKIEGERVRHWLARGAELTDKAKILIKKEAPEVLQEYLEKIIAQQAKRCEKKRTLRNKKRSEQAKG